MNATHDWSEHLRTSIRAACVLEATARKPGNVHPDASFEDVSFEDFVRSADVISPVLAETGQLGVGRAIREAVAVTDRAVGRNTNLGIILLIAPLAAVPERETLADGINKVLSDLTVNDARWCYEAVQLAHPGGLGDASDQDIHDEPTVTLVDAMRLAADRDRVAAQYANDFRDVLDFAMPSLIGGEWDENWERAVVRLQLQLMAAFPDTLIARKCGVAVAEESAERARAVLNSGWPEIEAGEQRISQLDEWLRADGHRRNPGTTADIVAASLFAAFRDRQLAVPTGDRSE